MHLDFISGLFIGSVVIGTMWGFSLNDDTKIQHRYSFTNAMESCIKAGSSEHVCFAVLNKGQN